MAIPGIPNNFTVQQANRQVLLTWTLSPGATSYLVNRSLDNITFTAYATSIGSSYLDTAVDVGVQYFYQVAASNTSGTSPYSTVQSAIPTPTSEMSLAEIRLKSKQRADMVNSQFVTDPEWNSYINQSMFELYDILVTSFEDYYLAAPATFVTTGQTQFYNLPDGLTTFLDKAGNSYAAPPFYKLRGVDLVLNSAQNAQVTLTKFNFIDRNKYLFPNSASALYGVFNPQYRVMGDKIEFIPLPASNQYITLWYIPRLTELLQDTDITTIGFSGWLEYVIVRSAILAMTKEESDTSKLEGQLLDVRKRIEAAAQNRDAGQPDTISDTRGNGFWGSGGGWNGPIGGW